MRPSSTQNVTTFQCKGWCSQGKPSTISQPTWIPTNLQWRPENPQKVRLVDPKFSIPTTVVAPTTNSITLAQEKGPLLISAAKSVDLGWWQPTEEHRFFSLLSDSFTINRWSSAYAPVDGTLMPTLCK